MDHLPRFEWKLKFKFEVNCKNLKVINFDCFKQKLAKL